MKRKPLSFGYVGTFLFIVGALLYGFSLPPYFYPGASAEQIALQLDVTPFLPSYAPIWRAGLHLLERLPGRLAFNINLAHTLLGLVTVCLFSWFMYLLPRGGTREEVAVLRNQPRVDLKLRLVAGLFTGLFLLSSVPFWLGATRSFHVIWGIFLVAIWMLSTIRLWREFSMSAYYLNLFIFGIGLGEYAGFIVLMVPAAFHHLYLLLVKEKAWFRTGVVSCLVLLGSLGGMISWLFLTLLKHPAYSWYDLSTFSNVAGLVAASQWSLATKLLPETGYIVLVIVSLVPFLILLLPKAGDVEEYRKNYGSYFMHVILSVLTFMALLNYPLAPWSMFQFNPFMVMPYVFIAGSAGYLVSYWYGVLSHIRSRHKKGIRRFKKGVSLCWVPLIFISWIAITWRNFPAINTGIEKEIDTYVNWVLEDSKGSTILITPGTGLEDIIILKAHAEQRDLTVINSRYIVKPHYLNYVKATFPSEKFATLANVSFKTGLQYWLRNEPTAAQQLVVMDMPELWLENGYRYYPERTIYRGMQKFNLAMLDELKALTQIPKQQPVDTHTGSPYRLHSLLDTYVKNLRRIIAKNMNNAGVLLEEEQQEGALPLYLATRAFFPENTSSLLNGLRMAKEQQHPQLEGLEEAYLELLNKPQANQRIWNLAFYHGIVRHPAYYARRGQLWALSGQGAVANEDITQAIDMLEDQESAQLALANYFLQLESPVALDVLERTLRKDPANLQALRGMFRFSALQGDFIEAQHYLDRIIFQHPQTPGLTMDQVALALLKGEYSQADELLQQEMKARPDDLTPRFIAVYTAHMMENRKLMERRWKTLHDDEELWSDELRLQCSRFMASIGRLGVAIRLVNNIDEQRLKEPDLVEYRLRLNVRARNEFAAKKLALELLQINTDHAYAHHVLGTIYYHQSQLDNALKHLKASVTLERNSDALTSLSFVLFLNNQLDEAETLILESLNIDPYSAAAWDTLGVICREKGLYNESEEALLNAIRLDHSDLTILYHLALTYEAQNEIYKAREIVFALMDNLSQVPRPIRNDFFKLRQRLL